MKLYIVTEVENNRLFNVRAFDNLKMANEYIEETLTGMTHWIQDIDHDNTWHCLWQTGTSCIELKEVELNDITI